MADDAKMVSITIESDPDNAANSITTLAYNLLPDTTTIYRVSSSDAQGSNIATVVDNLTGDAGIDLA